MNKYFQPEIETMPLKELQALQSERLVRQIAHVYENCAAYREKMDEAGIKPEDIKGIQDISRLPFVTKDDLKDVSEFSPPAEPQENVSWPFTLRRMWTSGMNAVPGPSLPQAAQKMTLSMFATVMVCLQVVLVLMAVPIFLEV